MKLHHFKNSSASYRVRIAQHLKGIKLDYQIVDMPNKEQRSDAYGAKNPHRMVPILETDNGMFISQSMAIIEYFEDISPSNSLLPDTSEQRARARNLAQMLASEAGVLQSMVVQDYLKEEYNFNDDVPKAWISHWLTKAFTALEQHLCQDSNRGGFCLNNKPGLVECFLIPQLNNARRFGATLPDFPLLSEIEKNCLALEAFQNAHPENQN